MGLESGTYIDDLVVTNPAGGDDRSTSDDHHRLIKAVLKNSFPNIDGAVTATPAELNAVSGLAASRLLVSDGSGLASVSTVTAAEAAYLAGVTSAIQTQLDGKKATASRGALVYGSGGTQNVNDATQTNMLFDLEDYDTDAIHSTVSNTERLTVPAAVTKIRLTAQIVYSTDATGVRMASFLKNASGVYAGAVQDARAAASGLDTIVQVDSPILVVTAGDYFTLSAYQTSGGALNVEHVSYKTWFAMEIVE